MIWGYHYFRKHPDVRGKDEVPNFSTKTCQVGLHLSSSFGAAFIASVPGKFEKKNLEGNFFEIGFHRFFLNKILGMHCFLFFPYMFELVAGFCGFFPPSEKGDVEPSGCCKDATHEPTP